MQTVPYNQHSYETVHSMPSAAQHYTKVIAQAIKSLAVTQAARRLQQP